MTQTRLQVVDWLLAVAAACAAAAVMWTAASWWAMRARALEASAELTSAMELATAVQRARATPALLADEAPSGDLLSLVSDTLGRAGVPASVLRRVQPEADGVNQRIDGVALPVRRSAMRVELEGVTLPELGRVLAVWRTQNPEWTPVLVNLSSRPEVTREDMASPQSTPRASSPFQPPRWTVSMSMATLYLAVTGTDARAATDARGRGGPHGAGHHGPGLDTRSDWYVEPLARAAVGWHRSEGGIDRAESES